jgi:phosphate transport system substrate-binding protein
MKRLLISCLILLSGFGLVMCSSPTSNADKAASNSSTSSIQDVGSDTLVNLALAWAERYQQSRPNIRISVTGGGSGTGLAALINGTTDIANASRAITSDEIKQAKAKGENPKEFVVSRDAIAVIVNPTNPINKLTLKQISRIYKGETNNWSELGGENRPIVRLSRESNSGTHVYFLGAVIRLGSSTDKSIFSEDTLLLPSSEGIISELKDNPNAIGYDGLGYVTPDVKVIAVAKDITGPYVLPSADTVNNNTYPISRDLYMYTNGDPTGALKDYLDWIYTSEAQKIVSDLGFVPVKPVQ